ncbi:hypothetical protein FNF27_05208 [Cafeteria roenbergensis]|uniref:Uncharacterized protein n=1 Tax=Cafeteria roenbergensis TaxID=33653 RepID=A0A5A8E6E3_CAFRO|nr:hypothetical protein FNF27_05208 [Cafeteria roenbergensis]
MFVPMSPLRYPGSEQGAVAIKVPRVAATVPSRFETVVSVGARERDAFGSREPSTSCEAARHARAHSGVAPRHGPVGALSAARQHQPRAG